MNNPLFSFLYNSLRVTTVTQQRLEIGDTSASQGSPHSIYTDPKTVTLTGSPIETCREPLLHLPDKQSGEHPLGGHTSTIQALCPLDLMDLTVALGKLPST